MDAKCGWRCFGFDLEYFSSRSKPGFTGSRASLVNVPGPWSGISGITFPSREAQNTCFSLFSKTYRLAAIRIQVPVEWEQDEISSQQIGRSVDLTTHVHRVSKLTRQAMYLRIT